MELRLRVEQVREKIAAACARRHRSEGSVRLLAATKGVAPPEIAAAYAAGIRCFGENRVQEREAKFDAVLDLNAEWHLIGPLQSNKAARALAAFACLQTVDSLALAHRLDQTAERMGLTAVPVLLEVNIGREPQKHGFLPELVGQTAAIIYQAPRLHLRGVMAVPPQSAQAEASRPYFAALAELADVVRRQLGRTSAGWEVSMGMSHDFEVAVEEGATMVRLGTALFGPRTPGKEL